MTRNHYQTGSYASMQFLNCDKKKKKKERERDCSKFLTILFGGKNPKLLEPAPYTGVGDDSDDNYEDCD